MRRRCAFLVSAACVSVLALALVVTNTRLSSLFSSAEDKLPYTISFRSKKNKFHAYTDGIGYSGDATITTELGNPIGFHYHDVQGAKYTWHVLGSEGYFYNTDPIHGMEFITLDFQTNGAAFSIHYSHDGSFDHSQSFVSSTSESTIFDFNGLKPNYFKVVNDSGADLSVSSFAISLSCLNHYPNLTISSEDEEKGFVSGPSGAVLSGSQATVTATPNAGYSFAGWYEGESLVSAENPYTFEMPSSDYSLVARFAKECTAKYYGENDVLLYETTFGEGENPEYVGDKPTKPTTSDTQYSFGGWDLVSSEDDIYIYKPHFDSCTAGLDFYGGSVTRYQGTSKNVVIPTRWNGVDITSIGNWAFEGCSSITSVFIPSSITSIGDSAFSGCASLTILCEATTEPSGWDPYWNSAKRPVVWGYKGETKTIGGYTYSFGEVDGEKRAYLIDFDEFITEFEVPEEIDGCPLEGIPGDLFRGNKKIKSIVLPSCVTSIAQEAFFNCSALESIVFPDSVISIGGSAFQGCTSLSSVKLGKGLTTIENYAFDGCTSLGWITLPDSVVSIGISAFQGCTSLNSVFMSDGIASIGGWAFYNCSSLNNITIPSGVTSIEAYTFSGCASLTSIVIPDNVASIGSHAFEGCTQLSYAKLGKGLTMIWDNAFSRCAQLKSIVIPEGVTYMGHYAFYGCDSITIYCEAPSQPTDWDSAWNPGDRPVVWGYHA